MFYQQGLSQLDAPRQRAAQAFRRVLGEGAKASGFVGCTDEFVRKGFELRGVLHPTFTLG